MLSTTDDITDAGPCINILCVQQQIMSLVAAMYKLIVLLLPRVYMYVCINQATACCLYRNKNSDQLPTVDDPRFLCAYLLELSTNNQMPDGTTT
jgi:hypothetical protein